MKLSKKTFLYSLVLAVLLVGFIAGYFVFMLPLLYVDYVMQSDYEGFVELQRGYMEQRSYDNLNVRNPNSSLTVEIPEEGSRIIIANYFFRMTVEVKDERLLRLLERVRYYVKNPREFSDLSEDEKEIDRIFDEVRSILQLDDLLPEDYPLDFQVETNEGAQVFQGENETIHVLSDRLLIWEGSVTDGKNYYTSYFSFGTMPDAVIVSVLSVMTPQMEEIKPVVLLSLPMITAVVILLILIASRIFSGGIVNPVIRLAAHAQALKTAGVDAQVPFLIPDDGRGRRRDRKQEDEVTQLAKALEELYTKLRESYRSLEENNRLLAEENKRQEVFLRASSHQLKTPITAALLLVDGMLQEVGRYKDAKAYLPQVKEQLKSMQKIVEDILYLNHCAEHLEPVEFPLAELLSECLAAYRVQLADRKISVCLHKMGGDSEGKAARVKSDRDILKKMIDNLLSNAVQYTPEGGKVEILETEKGILIRNYGSCIEEELLPSVFEPFVTSNRREKGHGLGLYVTAYYAGLLGISVGLRNLENGVEASLYFPDSGER